MSSSSTDQNVDSLDSVEKIAKGKYQVEHEDKNFDHCVVNHSEWRSGQSSFEYLAIAAKV